MPKSVTSFAECRKKILSGAHRGFRQNSVCLVSTLLNRSSPNIGSKCANLHRKPGRHFSLIMRTTSPASRSEEHTSELQSLRHLVCRLLLEKKNKITHE